jgi:hypothetical protein
LDDNLIYPVSFLIGAVIAEELVCWSQWFN